MIKARPRIEVRVPREIVPGTDVSTLVVLHARRPVEVEHVDVELRATEHASLGDGASRTLELLHLGARLSEARVLPAGRTELPVRIPLPPWAPPSHRGRYGRIEYALRVHVSIAWWPDRRADYELHVVPVPVESPEVTPALYSADPSGPRGNEPHAELSLASTWTRAGELVSGALALHNVRHQRYTRATIALVAEETVHLGGRAKPLEMVRYAIPIGLDGAGEGEPVPFQFRVPTDAPPELLSEPRPVGASLVTVGWALEVQIGVGWGSGLTLRAPFRVLPRSLDPRDAPKLDRAPPTVGSSRLNALWSAVGTTHGLVLEGDVLRGRIGATELSIRRDHRGREGIYLVAEIEHPPLHLDLAVEPASALRQMMGGDVTAGDVSWDRDHHVVARDPAQAQKVLQALLPWLKAVRLRRLDDRGAVIEERDAGQVRERLDMFLVMARELAQALERERTTLPPPTGMEAALAEWRALARTLSGPLETARLFVRGTLGTFDAEVRLAFDGRGRPLCTWLTVDTPTPFGREHVFAWYAQQGPASDAIAARFRGPTAEHVTVLAEGASELAIEPEHLVVRLPFALGLPDAEGRAQGAAYAERKLERMAQLALALRGVAAPYR